MRDETHQRQGLLSRALTHPTQERERLRRSDERFDVKLRLIRQLYERGYSREQIIGVFEFIDWGIQLSEAEDRLFWEAVKTLEEEKQMPYVATGERIGREQGLQQGSLEEARTLLLEALDERFGQVPTPLAETIQHLDDQAQLRRLVRQAIRCSSLHRTEGEGSGQMNWKQN